MRLIDADAFLEKMKRTNRYFDVVFDVEEMPTVDAVEVIRCKDCKHYDGKWLCKICGVPSRKSYDFCSYGERKDGDVDG